MRRYIVKTGYNKLPYRNRTNKKAQLLIYSELRFAFVAHAEPISNHFVVDLECFENLELSISRPK